MENENARPEIMIDIETLGVFPGSVIASFAALAFDADGNVVNSLEINVDLEQQTKAGLRIQTQTVLWWLRQSEEAREAAFFRETVSAEDACEHLCSFITSVCPSAIWAKSPQFDIVQLEFFLDAFGYKPPWSYRVIRDVRTLFADAGYVEPKAVKGVAHSAFDDAVHQIEGVIAARDLLSGVAA